MDFSNLKNKLFLVFCFFIVLSPFIIYCTCFADTSVLPIEVLNGKYVTSSGTINNSAEGDGAILIYHFYPNCSYTISNTSLTENLYYSTSDEFKTSGSIGNRTSLPANTTIDFDNSENDSYLYFYITSLHDGANVQDYIVINNISGSMSSAVGGLVSEVGVNSVWNVFNTGINYIYVVVLSVFGIFIISLVIKKITKGKEGF